jgi:hypothetical protein
VDVGSLDLAHHQLDLALGSAPALDLDGLTRLTSAVWRVHASYIVDEGDSNDEDLHRPMWSRLWAQWRRHGEVGKEVEENRDVVSAITTREVASSEEFLTDFGRLLFLFICDDTNN